MAEKEESSSGSIPIDDDDSEEETGPNDHEREIEGSSTVKMIPISRTVARSNKPKKKPRASNAKAKNAPRRSKCCRI